VLKINEYIESGILESYVLGSASESEIDELLYLKKKYPEIQTALNDLETDMERIAQHMAVPPPPHFWFCIESEINELMETPKFDALTVNKPGDSGKSRSKKSSQFIEIESASNKMRVHKIWQWIFIAVFALWKIFLVLYILLYIENRDNKKEIEHLKLEINTLKNAVHNTHQLSH
jgi:hypothetical protein